MPKIKTNRAAAKRFRFTASGKIKRAQAGKSHLLTKKSQGRKRHLRSGALVHETNVQSVKYLIPYGS